MVTPRVFDNWNWRKGVSKIPLIFRTCYLNNDTNGISETFRVSKRHHESDFLRVHSGFMGFTWRNPLLKILGNLYWGLQIQATQFEDPLKPKGSLQVAFFLGHSADDPLRLQKNGGHKGVLICSLYTYMFHPIYMVKRFLYTTLVYSKKLQGLQYVFLSIPSRGILQSFKYPVYFYILSLQSPVAIIAYHWFIVPL